MISQIKKNRIDLFSLKTEKEMKYVEKKFEIFLNRKIFKNRKSKKKYLYQIKSCVCGNKLGHKFSSFFLKPFLYRKCRFCGTISINPMLNNEGLKLIYSDRGIYNIYRKNFFEKKNKKTLRSKTINKRKIDQVVSLFKKKKFSLLDFGCGDGNFLFNLKDRGISDLVGVDSKYDNLEKINNIYFYNNLENVKKKFDCITLWGVLEHLNDPNNLIDKIKLFLKKGGYLVMEFPSADSLLMNYIKTNNFNALRFIEKGRHLFFFSKRFIEIFCKKKKFKISYLETNGLDLQTILGSKDKSQIKNILDIQEILDSNMMSDHFRVFLKKIN